MARLKLVKQELKDRTKELADAKTVIIGHVLFVDPVPAFKTSRTDFKELIYPIIKKQFGEEPAHIQNRNEKWLIFHNLDGLKDKKHLITFSVCTNVEEMGDAAVAPPGEKKAQEKAAKAAKAEKQKTFDVSKLSFAKGGVAKAPREQLDGFVNEVWGRRSHPSQPDEYIRGCLYKVLDGLVDPARVPWSDPPRSDAGGKVKKADKKEKSVVAPAKPKVEAALLASSNGKVANLAAIVKKVLMAAELPEAAAEVVKKLGKLKSKDVDGAVEIVKEYVEVI